MSGGRVGLTVEAVGKPKEVNTRFGTKPTYSFKAGGEWYQTGFKNHNLANGDVVDFEFEANKYGNQVDVETIKKSTAAPSTTVAALPPRSGQSGGSGKGVFPIPALDGQRSIVRQNALTNAREMVGAAIVARLARDKSGVMPENDLIADEIVRVAKKFEAYTAGDADLEEVQQELANKKAA